MSNFRGGGVEKFSGGGGVEKFSGGRVEIFFRGEGVIIIRHDISPVFTGIPVFLSCPRSFLWKSQNRFKNLDDFYGGGGIFAG